MTQKILTLEEAKALITRAESRLFGLEMEYASITGSGPGGQARFYVYATLAVCEKRMEQIAARIEYLRTEIDKYRSAGTQQQHSDNILKHAQTIGLVAEGTQA